MQESRGSTGENQSPADTPGTSGDEEVGLPHASSTSAAVLCVRFVVRRELGVVPDSGNDDEELSVDEGCASAVTTSRDGSTIDDASDAAATDYDDDDDVSTPEQVEWMMMMMMMMTMMM